MQNHQHPIYHEEVHKIFPTLELFGVGLIPSFPRACWLLTHSLNAESKRGSVG